jgi:ABC-type uncharacterized transport system ATPase subunit
MAEAPETRSDPSSGDPRPLLRARGMTKSFGSTFAVADIDIDVRDGEVHAILGENGAGKSTLISMLCGLYRPDSGGIEVRGVRQSFSSPRDGLRAGIGVVHQDFRLVGPFSALENVVLGTGQRPNRRAAERCKALCRNVGFNITLESPVSSFSVGEQQQVEILKLLFRGTEVLVLDEPTAVLTPQQSEQLFVSLRSLADAGKAIVFVSHRLREVAAVADHVTILRGGRLISSGPSAGASHAELAELMMGKAVDQRIKVSPSIPGVPLLSLREAATAPGHRGALRGINLSVHAGEIVGVAGVSGNGQADLAEVAAGMRSLHRGTRLAACDPVGFIPEDRLSTGLVGSMSIAENLAMRDYRRSQAYRPWFLSRAKMVERALPLIDEFSIPAAPQVLAGSLSGGGQQRTLVAREMTAAPTLLVVSQPTRGLDIVSAKAVRDHILAVRARGGGVLLLSEDLDELISLSDRIIVMLHGRIATEVSRAEADRQKIGLYMTGAQATGTGEA